ncbi:isoprenoid synthase domain-containing protein-like isoform X2 [Limulus polyphemus]|nr:isoprenoid synthase domain-containing protein-like isoform X2 [Limulus polyphemus]
MEKPVDRSVGVILPAAGNGERMGVTIPKQFCKILGRPLIQYTVEAFLRFSWIKQVVVVAASDRMDLMKETLAGLDSGNYGRLRMVSGSSSRHRSIQAGLKALASSENSPDIVVIHDGVRPLVPPEILIEVVCAAKDYGAAGAVRPLVSTVLRSDEMGFMEEALDRSQYCASEMPQAFVLSLIKEAYNMCSDHDLDYGTECLHLVQKYMGLKPRLIEGTADLWKVTHRKDLYAAETTVKERRRVHLVAQDIDLCLLEQILLALKERFSEVQVCEDTIVQTPPCHLVRVHNGIFLTDVLSETEAWVKALSPCVQPSSLVSIVTKTDINENGYPSTVALQARAQAIANMARNWNITIFFIFSPYQAISPRTCEDISKKTAYLLFEESDILSGQIIYV